MRPEERIDLFLNKLKIIWKRNPDLRFTQLLFNHGIENNLYYIEENELLEQAFDIPKDECTLWGTYGAKPGELRRVPIRYLSEDHIRKILEEKNISDEIRDAINVSLKYRQENKTDNSILRCRECKSGDVELLHHVNMATGKITDAGSEEIYCNSCKTHTEGVWTI